MSSQEEQAWKLCGAGLCPRPGAIREVELLLSLGRLDKHQGAAQDQTGSAASILCYPGLGPPLRPGLALFHTKGTLTELQRHLPLIPES